MAKQVITTSIPYVNAEPHIGFLLELLAADVLANYYRQILGKDNVFFLTGTDEHGLKIQQAAQVTGEQPQAFADRIAKTFQQLTEDFEISNDFFIRTTDPGHIQFVQDAWQKLDQANVIEKRTYEGLYCTGCEAFKTEREIKDGKCLIHDLKLEQVKEENYFLKILPEAKVKIRDWVKKAVVPSTKHDEILNILEEFEGVSISRPKDKLSWGVPVPGDETQTMYVWTDALLNYLSGIELSGRDIKDWWPGSIQIVGKDIIKFHAIVWPAILLALNYDLPGKLLVHGFVNINGQKISKSEGNVVYPRDLIERYGVEASRYLVLRQLNFYDDSNFVWSEFDAIYNGELANGLGNLLSRIIGIAQRAGYETLPPTEETRKINGFEFNSELAQLNDEVREADNLITRSKLWEDTKSKKAELREAVGHLFKVSDILKPFLPEAAVEIRRQLRELDPKPLFPRLK